MSGNDYCSERDLSRLMGWIMGHQHSRRGASLKGGERSGVQSRAVLFPKLVAEMKCL